MRESQDTCVKSHRLAPVILLGKGWPLGKCQGSDRRSGGGQLLLGVEEKRLFYLCFAEKELVWKKCNWREEETAKGERAGAARGHFWEQ